MDILRVPLIKCYDSETETIVHRSNLTIVCSETYFYKI